MKKGKGTSTSQAKYAPLSSQGKTKRNTKKKGGSTKCEVRTRKGGGNQAPFSRRGGTVTVGHEAKGNKKKEKRGEKKANGGSGVKISCGALVKKKDDHGLRGVTGSGRWGGGLSRGRYSAKNLAQVGRRFGATPKKGGGKGGVSCPL